MKSRKLWLGLVALLVVTTSLIMGWRTLHYNRLKDDAVALVDGVPISQAKVEARLQSESDRVTGLRQTPDPSKSILAQKVEEVRWEILSELIDAQLILNAFHALGATIRNTHLDQAIDRIIQERFEGNREQFLAELEQQNLSLVDFRALQEEAIIIQAMRARQVGNPVAQLSDEEVRAYWEAHPERFTQPAEVKLRTLTLRNDPAGEAQLREILSMLKEGADFKEMATAHSMDSGAAEGGLRGTFRPDDISERLAIVAFAIKPRTPSEIIDLGAFLCLIYVDERIAGHIIPFEEVEEEVRRQVIQEKREKLLEDWIQSLKAKADIWIAEEYRRELD